MATCPFAKKAVTYLANIGKRQLKDPPEYSSSGINSQLFCGARVYTLKNILFFDLSVSSYLYCIFRADMGEGDKSLYQFSVISKNRRLIRNLDAKGVLRFLPTYLE